MWTAAGGRQAIHEAYFSLVVTVVTVTGGSNPSSAGKSKYFREDFCIFSGREERGLSYSSLRNHPQRNADGNHQVQGRSTRLQCPDGIRKYVEAEFGGDSAKATSLVTFRTAAASVNSVQCRLQGPLGGFRWTPPVPFAPKDR